MKITEEDYLKHHGVMGMHWGVITPEKPGTGRRRGGKDSSPDHTAVKEFNAKILKANPHAAVANYEVLDKQNRSPEQKAARSKKIRNIAIGVGVGITLAAGAYLYATHKEEVDGAVKSFLEKFGNKPIEEVSAPGVLTSTEAKGFKSLGIVGIKTEQEATNANMIAS